MWGCLVRSKFTTSFGLTCVAKLNGFFGDKNSSAEAFVVEEMLQRSRKRTPVSSPGRAVCEPWAQLRRSFCSLTGSHAPYISHLEMKRMDCLTAACLCR